MKNARAIGLTFVAVCLLGAGLYFLSPRSVPALAGGKQKDTRQQDREAIRATSSSFAKAFESGDAKAVAMHWTANGEYVADDGTKYHGRKELEEGYRKFFETNKNLKLDIEIESLRFPSSNTAVEEGYLKVKKGKGEYVTSKYSVLHVKEDGKWLMAIVREWPSEGIALRDLEWLVGSWRAKRDDAEVVTTYRWGENKVYLLADFTINGKEGKQTGKQIFASDPSTGLVRSWIFTSNGGFGEGVWIRDVKKWLAQSQGVLPNGLRTAATNILTPVDHDSFLWQTTDRYVEDEAAPDLPPIRVTRVQDEK